MSNTLYDEAIADAKKLRELAEKNAKQAIIESITPKIRRLIEDQLINDDKNTSDHVLSEILISETKGRKIKENIRDSDVILDEVALETLMGLFDPEKVLENSEKNKVLNAIHESIESLGRRDQQKLVSITRKLKEDSRTLPSDSIVIGQELNSINIKENSKMSRNGEVLYEIDLNDIAAMLSEEKDNTVVNTEEQTLREIMAELDTGADDEKTDEGGPDMDLSELYSLFEQDEEAPVDPMDDPAAEDIAADEDLADEDLADEAPADEGPELPPEIDDAIAALEDAIASIVVGGAEEAPPEVGEEEMVGAGIEDLAETVEVDLGMLRSEIRRMKRLSEGEHDIPHDEGYDQDETGLYETDEEEDEDEKEKQEGGKNGSTKTENRKLRRAILNQGRNSRAMSSKLDEYRSAVVSLREQLTEMNLFNAKLLYVNKMLQNRDVSSSQRRSIIEALDSARSLREVKLLYKSLAESIGNRKSGRTLNESAVRRNLGSASRATRQASSTSSQVAEVSRWATLAGINK